MTEEFTAAFEVAWGDLDSNRHLKNTAYLDYAAQTRFLYFRTRGFGPEDFERHGFGPVVLEDHVSYRREMRFLDRFSVDFQAAGATDDGARFRISNRFLRADGKEAARVVSHGGWFDLKARRIVAPPAELKAAMDALTKTANFAPL